MKLWKSMQRPQTVLAILFVVFMLSGCDDIHSITQENLKDGAEKYLQDGGLLDEEIQRIEDYLTK